MKLNANNLTSHLSQQQFPCYWIAGDDVFLSQQACDIIRSHAKNHGYINKIIFHVNQQFDWNQFIAETQCLSLFSERTLIEIRLGEKKLSDKGRKILAEYLQNPAEDKLILISSSKLDSASQKTKWFKAIEQYTGFLAIWPLQGREVLAWIAAELKKHKLHSSREIVAILAEKGEGNLLAIAQDIEKLAILYHGEELTLEKVLQAISDNSRYDVFDLVDTALLGNAKKTLKILRGLKQEGVEPILVLWALARELRLLLAVLGVEAQPSDTTLRKHGVWPKRMPLVRAALQRQARLTYQNLLIQCASIDAGIKGVQTVNVWDELESIAVRLSGVNI